MLPRSLLYFDCIYVVNLTYRRDRRREIAAQLQRVGLALGRPPVKLFPAVRPDEAGPFPTIGTRGCFMSHLGVLRDAERAGHGRILLLEDDVDFIESFEADFERVAERLQREAWDVFYGGYRIDPAQRRAADADVVETVESGTPIVTAHFIAFSGSTIASMARHLERLLERPTDDPAGGPMHVDGAYTRYRASHPACKTMISVRQLAVQRSSRTDIHALRWFDRTPVFRFMAQAARSARRSFLPR